MEDIARYQRGQIWWYDYGSNKRGEISGVHRVVIINVVTNQYSPSSAIIVPIISAETVIKYNLTNEFYMVPLKLHKDVYVCCNQIKSILVEDFAKYVSTISAQKMEQIDETICKVLCIKKIKEFDDIVMDEIVRRVKNNLADSLAREALGLVKSEDNEMTLNIVNTKLKQVIQNMLKDDINVNVNRKRKYIYICEETREQFETLEEIENRYGVHETYLSRRFTRNGDRIHIAKLDKTFVRRLRDPFESSSLENR